MTSPCTAAPLGTGILLTSLSINIYTCINVDIYVILQRTVQWILYPLPWTPSIHYPVNHIVIPLLAGKHHKKLLGAEQLSWWWRAATVKSLPSVLETCTKRENRKTVLISTQNIPSSGHINPRYCAGCWCWSNQSCSVRQNQGYLGDLQTSKINNLPENLIRSPFQ